MKKVVVKKTDICAVVETEDAYLVYVGRRPKPFICERQEPIQLEGDRVQYTLKRTPITGGANNGRLD